MSTIERRAVEVGTVPMIDGHVHLWDRHRNPQPWIDPSTMPVLDRDFGLAELRAMLTATGADAAIVVQSTNSFAETVDLLALAADGPIAGVVGWVDLTGDVPAQLARLRGGVGGGALRGVRHLAHLEPDPAWLLRADVARGLDALAGSGLAVEIVVRDHQLPLAASVVRAHPESVFVLDHLGNPVVDGPLERWQRDLAALAAEPNVLAKLSGLVTAVARPWTIDDLAPVVDAALDTFGPARLLYGSDYPLVELAGHAAGWADGLRRMLDAHAPADRDAIFGGTAATTYGVPVHA